MSTNLGIDMNRFWVWIDGAIHAPGDARIEVFDHGFLYGDSIYETFRGYDGRIFGVDEHLERLASSAAAIRLTLPWGPAELKQILAEVVAAAPNGKDAGLRLVVTRGAGPLGLDPALCRRPRLVIFGWPLDPGPHPRSSEGVDVVVTSVRRNPPAALDPHIKSGNFLNNILAFQEAHERGAFEGILLSMEDAVTEGTTSNVFWMRDGEVHTSTEVGILLGVTRLTVLAILGQLGIPCQEGRYPAEDLQNADEAFITSTLKGVLPVARIDERELPRGAPGPLTKRIFDAYEAMVRA